MTRIPRSSRRLVLGLAAICTVLPFAAPIRAQQASQPPASAAAAELAELRAAASAAFATGPASSAPAWRAVVAAAPDDGEGWHRLGYALHVAGELEAALAAHRRATELGFSPISAYNVACALALLGRRDEAFTALEAAVDKGFVNHEHAGHDADLASLRDDPRFAAALARMQTAAAAAEADRVPVAVLIYPGVELLDFAGPLEAFGAAHDARGPKFKAFTVARDKAPLRIDGVRVVADHDFEDCPKPQIVVVPGGRVSAVTGDEPTMHWLAKVRPELELTMSVCNGAMVLARLGALEGRRATTHHGTLARLAAVSGVTIVPGARFVDAGEVVTAAGVSAGIDGALHVIERYCGRDVAWSTARYMEYEWRPDRVGPYGLDDPARTAARNAIAVTVEHFLDGLVRTGGPEHVEASLHRDLDKFGFGRALDDNGHHRTYPRTYDDMHAASIELAERGGNPDAWGEFEILDVQDLVAVVKVREPLGYDYLTLGRFGDEWRVRHVLWQQLPDSTHSATPTATRR
ncbi:MAG: DJ-1/PfpI family protein [Planctomycetes bacterium]|nr:DJ-1/PfpI family protein [Planctomycetota bacterium]